MLAEGRDQTDASAVHLVPPIMELGTRSTKRNERVTTMDPDPKKPPPLSDLTSFDSHAQKHITRPATEARILWI
jgi:hypothetical protein